MKRIGNIYEDIYKFSNLHDAYLKARKGKRYRNEVLEYTRKLEENLIALQNELIWGMYRQGEYREFKVFIPKVRTIKALPFRDRVLQHAVNTIIEPIFEKQFYTHSYACRKGKGLHDASKQLKTWQFLAKKNGQKLYCLKCDIKKYFDFVGGASLDGTVSKKEDVINLVLQQTGIENSQVLMVGDRKFDLEGARRMNMDAVGVLYGFGSYEELSACKNVALINDITELEKILA